MVVILGSEHRRVTKFGKERKQERVQVCTVENDLTTRMEEFHPGGGEEMMVSRRGDSLHAVNVMVQASCR